MPVNKRWWVSGGVLLSLLLLASYFLAIPVDKVHVVKIGILVVNDLRLEKIHGLKAGLTQLGYQEGQDVLYEVRNAQNDIQQLPILADQLLKGKPDVLLAGGAVEAQALKEITANEKERTPVIFMGTLSPVETGLVTSAMHPAGNLSGLNNYHLELTPKRLELLHRLLPEVHRVAVLGDLRVPSFERAQTDIQTIAKAFSLSVGMYTVSTSSEVNQVFQVLKERNVEAIMLLPGFFLETSTQQIVDLAVQRNIPVFGVYPSDTEQGCIASYGASYESQGVQSAHLVNKVLRGTLPSDLPVETPDQLVFSVNLKTAQRLGVRLAPDVLSFADQVIQP